MLKKVYVPLDDTEFSERALPYATTIARAAGGKLVLVHALTSGGYPIHARSRLEAIAERLQGEGIDADVVVTPPLLGDPARAIVETARTCATDVIVMTTRGRRGLHSGVFGSVFDAVLRHASAPVLLIPPACNHIWSANQALRVLVPLDESRLAEAALGAVDVIGMTLPTELFLIEVVQPADLAFAHGYCDPPPDPQTFASDTRGYLEGLATTIRSHGKIVTAMTGLGDPASEIVAVAGQKHIDLIVMATHGRSGLARLLLGSVAAATVRLSHTPILLLRPASIRRAVQEERAETDEPSNDERALDELSAGGPGRSGALQF